MANYSDNQVVFFSENKEAVLPVEGVPLIMLPFSWSPPSETVSSLLVI